MRLDIYLTEKGIASSRTRAQELIRSGAVTVNGKAVTKASFPTDDGMNVDCDLSLECKYVSRGGLKLEAALEHFGIDVTGKACIDIGASTGGFTDCLLQRGAKLVYAVDSGTAQLSEKLKADKRVRSFENTNARYLKDSDFDISFDIAVMDVSFISQTKLYSAVTEVLAKDGIFISLVKPQFEVGKRKIGKGGIVNDEKARSDALDAVISAASGYGLCCIGAIDSPISGGDGNKEFLACFRYE